MAANRVELLQRGSRPGVTRALEIGALDKPILTKPEYDVVYLDYATTDELAEKYLSDPNVGDIVGVDLIWNGEIPIPIQAGDSFDFIVASHVVEHVPDPVQWLAYFAEVLTPGGLVSLAVPDMRFSFDLNRRLTEFSDILDDHLRGAVVASYGQLYDFHTKAIPVDTASVWSGTADYTGVIREGDLHREAFDACLGLQKNPVYVDVHCHTFTPTSFVDIIERLGQFDLLDFEIADLIPTQPNELEFFIRLRRLDPELSASEIAERRAAGLAAARAAINSGPQISRPSAEQAPGEPGRPPFTVSPREERFLQTKRAVLSRARRLAHRPV